ncbi:MAG TPA: S41 family peptidase [bacterium]|nr:S41 family peptidase [bacterium]
MARITLTLLLLTLLINPLGVVAAPADLAVAREAIATLESHHWNPHLDLPAIIGAGVGGLRLALQHAGIDATDLQELPAGLDEPAALNAFGDRLDRAAALAGGKIPERTLLYAGLRAMLKAVGGSHTVFLTPTQRTVAEAILQGKPYDGIGINFVKLDQHWILSAVIPGAPADRAGVRRGDRVVQIDGVAVDGMDSPEIQGLFLGPPGTVMQMTVLRGTAQLPFVIGRAAVTRPVADSRMINDEIAYLKLYGYSLGSGKIIRTELTRLLAARPRGLIVDLREDGGGLITEYVETMGLFLPRGTVIYREIGRDGVAKVGRTAGDPIVPPIPLVVLIDSGAASNGELSAAALKEHLGASLVGEHTAGELEYATLLQLMDGSGMNVAFARVLTAKGIELEGHGYPPDVAIPLDPGSTRDFQLECGVRVMVERLLGVPSKALGCDHSGLASLPRAS